MRGTLIHAGSRLNPLVKFTDSQRSVFDYPVDVRGLAAARANEKDTQGSTKVLVSHTAGTLPLFAAELLTKLPSKTLLVRVLQLILLEALG